MSSPTEFDPLIEKLVAAKRQRKQKHEKSKEEAYQVERKIEKLIKTFKTNEEKWRVQHSEAKDHGMDAINIRIDRYVKELNALRIKRHELVAFYADEKERCRKQLAQRLKTIRSSHAKRCNELLRRNSSVKVGDVFPDKICSAVTNAMDHATKSARTALKNPR